MTELQKGQLWEKNGFDFRVHFIQNGQVYGCVYRSEDRGDLDPEKDWYQFRRKEIPKFWEEKPTLVEGM